MPQRRQKIDVGGGTIGSTFREVAKPRYDASRVDRLGQVLGLVDKGIRTGLNESKKAQAEKGALARQELETEIAHLPPEERQQRVDAMRQSLDSSTNGFLASITGAKEATFDEYDRVDATLSADEMHKAINSYVQENQDKVDKETLQNGIAGLMAEYTSRSKAISEKHFENFAPTAAKVANQWDTSIDKHYFEKQEKATIQKSSDAMNAALNNYVLTISGATSMDQLRNDPNARERMEVALNDSHNIEQISGLAQKYRKGLGVTTSLGGDARTRQVRDQIVKMARDLKNPSLLKALSLKDSAGRAMSDIDTEMVRGLALDLDSEKRRYDAQLQRDVQKAKEDSELAEVYKTSNTMNADFQEFLTRTDEEGAEATTAEGRQLAQDIDTEIKNLQLIAQRENAEEKTKHTAILTQKLLRGLKDKIYSNVGDADTMREYENLKATNDPGLDIAWLSSEGLKLTREKLIEAKGIVDTKRKLVSMQESEIASLERKRRRTAFVAPMIAAETTIAKYNALPQVKAGNYQFSYNASLVEDEALGIFFNNIEQQKNHPSVNDPEFRQSIMVKASEEASQNLMDKWDAQVTKLENAWNFKVNRQDPSRSGASIAERAKASATMGGVLDGDVDPEDIPAEERQATVQEALKVLNMPGLTTDQATRVVNTAVYSGTLQAIEAEGASGIIDMHQFVDKFIGGGAGTPEGAYDAIEKGIDIWGKKYRAQYPSSTAGLIAGTSTSKNMRFNAFKKDLIDAVFTSSGGFGGFFEKHTLADRVHVARKLEAMKSKYTGKGQDTQMMEFFFRQNGGIDNAIKELTGESEDKPKAESK